MQSQERSPADAVDGREVVRVGFSGSRLLYAPRRLPDAQTQALDDVLLPQLIERLGEAAARFGFAPGQPWCGVGQLAIGADTLFARALAALSRPLVVVLPQPLEAFLAAGDAGEPDFTPAEQARARALLAEGPHVPSLRVASTSSDRIRQFEDANRAIVAASDALVCLLRAEAGARPGGTRDLMQRAAEAGKPVWLLEVALGSDGAPRLSPWQRVV